MTDVNKKGQTLVELIIGIALFAMVIVGFMQGLNVGILSTHWVRQTNAALDLASSQLEYVKQQDYILYGNGSPVEGPPYKNVGGIPPGFSADDIEIAVENIDGNANGHALQQITVNVTYENGTRSVEVVGYKAPRLATVHGQEGWWIVNNNIGIPPLDGKWGYYYVIEPGTDNTQICATWVYTWSTQGSGFLLHLYLYEGIPKESWDQGAGLVREDAAPAPSLAKEGAAYQPEGENYLVTIETDPLPAGTYTVFFYNDASKEGSANTSSASVTYYW